MLTKTKSWVECQALGSRLAVPWAAGEMGRARMQSSSATEHVVQIKGLSQPGQECCPAGFGTRPGRAIAALMEALLDV